MPRLICRLFFMMAMAIGWPARAVAEAPPRPKFQVAVGMGASFDNAGLGATTSGLAAIPAFFATGGFDVGLFGVQLGVFANSANGRFRAPNLPVDRLALDGMLVIHPAALLPGDNGRFDMRVAHALSIDAGVGYERDSRIAHGAETVDRFGLLIGGHIDVPLTPAGTASELRVRLAVRRFFGVKQASFPGGDPAPDTRAEVFAALVSVF